MNTQYGRESNFDPALVSDAWVSRMSELDGFVVKELSAYGLFQAVTRIVGVSETQEHPIAEQQMDDGVTFYNPIALVDTDFPTLSLDEQYEIKDTFSKTHVDPEDGGMLPMPIKRNVIPRLRVTEKGVHPDDIEDDEVEAYSRTVVMEIDEMIKGRVPTHSLGWFGGIILAHDNQYKEDLLANQDSYVKWLKKAAEHLDVTIPTVLL